MFATGGPKGEHRIIHVDADELAAGRVVEAATEAGTLNFYNWAQYVNPKTYAAFTKATGTKVKKSFYDSNETLHAKLKAGARGYDLVCPSNYMTKQLIEEDLVEPLDWSKLRNVTKNVDPKFHNTPDDPKSTYSVVKDWGTTGFMYRTDKIKERPTTWREFVALTKKYGDGYHKDDRYSWLLDDVSVEATRRGTGQVSIVVEKRESLKTR